MLRFRILTYRPIVEAVRMRGTVSKSKVKEWKKVNYTRLPNPGIQRRVRIMEHEDRHIEEPGDVDDADFDFMELNQMHDLHESEEEKMKHIKQLKIVGNKYFKEEKGPNLLTWAEKEQIHYLHNSDADIWTIEKLAQSFPASETTIRKILKSKWRPQNADRVMKHDLAVQRNWDLLQRGKLQVDPELRLHLSEFTHRTGPVSHRPDTTGMFEDANGIPTPKHSEFRSIIESYKLLKCKDMPEDDLRGPDVLQRARDTSTVPKGDSFLLEGQKSFSRQNCVTLEKYRERVLKAIKKGHESSADAKLMVSKHGKREDVPEEIEDAKSATNSEMVKSNSAGPNQAVIEMSSDNDMHPPGRIRVPSEKWKQGCTFKVGDCYYDDDGTFLYRVPGMK